MSVCVCVLCSVRIMQKDKKLFGDVVVVIIGLPKCHIVIVSPPSRSDRNLVALDHHRHAQHQPYQLNCKLASIYLYRTEKTKFINVKIN